MISFSIAYVASLTLVVGLSTPVIYKMSQNTQRIAKYRNMTVSILRMKALRAVSKCIQTDLTRNNTSQMRGNRLEK